MKTVLAKAKQYWKGIVVALAAVAVLGVAVFDTYPTYLAKTGTLSPTECEQVAVLVAAYAYSKQNPGEAVPAKAKEIMDSATRISKRVAKYVIEKSPELADTPPMFAYMQLLQSCQMSEGVYDLK